MKSAIVMCMAFAVCQSFGASQNQALKAEDRARKRLADLLEPSAGAEAMLAGAGPVARAVPSQLNDPEAPLPVFRGTPPQLTTTAGKLILPSHSREDAPLAQYRAQPKTPKVELPAKPLVRLPSLDVESPVALPILAKPQSDRASLADPTLEASVAAALAPVSASRITPVPFAPLNLPDPFEHSQAVRLRFTPDELAVPQSSRK